MSRALNRGDYENILEFYKMKIPKSFKELRDKAENMLANKLCRCIKKVKKSVKKEGYAIAICKKSVLHRKGVGNYKFKCKKTPRLVKGKNTTRKLFKRKDK